MRPAVDSRRPFSLTILISALLLSWALPAAAQDDPIQVEVHENFTLRLEQVEVMVQRDPVELVAGVSRQFLGGQTILGEVELNAAISLAELEERTQAGEVAQMAFLCEEVTLYQVREMHVIGGESCEILPPGG